MKFTLRELSRDEINDELKRFRGDLQHRVCPLEVTLANGDKMSVWSLDEQKILALINAVLTDLDSAGRFKDQTRAHWATQIITCWNKENETVSASMIKALYELEKKFEKHASTVRDLTTKIGFQQKQDAKVIARYLNGMRGDYDFAVTNDEIVKILQQQEEFSEKRKAIEKAGNK